MDEALTLLSFGPEGWGDEIARGVWLTISLAVTVYPLGIALGLLIALAKDSQEPSLRRAAEIYTTIFRGLPELLTLFIIYFGLQILLRQIESLFVEEPTITVSSFLGGVIALTLVVSAYTSEAFLSALRAIPSGQYEGAYALGLSWPKAMAFIVLPQLIRLALPALENSWLVLLKDTALVSTIQLVDLLRSSYLATRVEKEPFLFYGVACLIYLILSIVSSTAFAQIRSWSKKGEVVR